MFRKNTLLSFEIYLFDFLQVPILFFFSQTIVSLSLIREDPSIENKSEDFLFFIFPQILSDMESLFYWLLQSVHSF